MEQWPTLVTALCGFGAYGTVNIVDVHVCTHVHTYTGLYSLHNFGPKWMYICVYFVHTCMCVIVRTYVELNMCWWTIPPSSVGTLRNECHCIHLAQSIFIKGPTVLHNGVHQSNPFGQYGLQQAYIQSVTVCIVIAFWQYICDSTKGSVCAHARACACVCMCMCMSEPVDFTLFSLFPSPIDVVNRKPACLMNPMGCMVNGTAQVESHPELGKCTHLPGKPFCVKWPPKLLCNYGVFLQLLITLYGSF